MSDTLYLLDTSAILTLIEGEDGAAKVAQIFRDEHVLLPWPVLMEVLYITRQEQGEEKAEYRYALLKQSGAQIIWEVDEPVLLTAARIKAGYRLSFADAVIAAMAIQRGAHLVHKDPEYLALQSEVNMDVLPFKS